MTLNNIINWLDTLIWETSLASMHRWQAWLIQMLRILIATARDIREGLPTLRAMGLVYTTLLSLVPLLAVSFSVLKGFGVHNQIEPMLLGLLEPLGKQGVEITNKIIGFVDNVNVRVLGSLSLVFLFYTVISLLTKIEQALNNTWRIREYRGLIQRITEYISVIMVGPVLIFTGIGLATTIQTSTVASALESMHGYGTLIWMASTLMSFLLIVGAITFIYILVPNERVKFRSAFTGAVVAALLWKLTGWVFTSFVAGSAKYSAIYSGFAVAIIFMIWLYLSWLILLVGASVAFYHQHPERTSSRQQVLRLSARLREKIGLLLMLRVGQSFHNDSEKLTRKQLSRNLDIAAEALALVIRPLEEHGLLTESCDRKRVYLPGRSLEHIRIRDIWDAVRSAQESIHLNPDNVASDTSVDELLQSINTSIDSTLDDMTLLDLVEGSNAQTTARPLQIQS
ncbi:MAG: YihY/virulence factor BrkB family protein [Thiotrichales bacterium]|nr:MAG: YihY/virulence factor BrkB family protein [Thiotrichales bacterium]